MVEWNRRSYSKEEFIDAWNSSCSIAECLRKLNKKDRGGNYRVVSETAEALGLNKDHMTGQGWNRGLMTPRPARPLSEILVADSKVSSSGLRKRLLREKIFEHKCYCCDNTVWMGKPIPLELEHINGNHRDNRLQNLTLLCPNCHAQTDTYRGKNQKRAGVGQRRAGELKIPDEDISIVGSNPTTRTCRCGKAISRRASSCTSCFKMKIDWPNKADLEDMIATHGYLKTGRLLGVSDNAVRKALKRL